MIANLVYVNIRPGNPICVPTVWMFRWGLVPFLSDGFMRRCGTGKPALDLAHFVYLWDRDAQSDVKCNYEYDHVFHCEIVALAT